MPSSYPGALDALTDPLAGDMQNSPSHSGIHTAANDAIEAIQAELGTDPAGAAATVKARLTAMDAVDALRVVGSNATTAPSSPVVGQVWVDHSTPATPVIKVWSGSAWVNPSSAGGGSGASGMVWASVTGGTVTTYTAAGGATMEVHTFTADSSLVVVSAGYAECLLVSGGGNGSGGGWVGSGGRTVRGLHALPAGTHAVTVGPGALDTTGSRAGEPSKIGTLLATGPGTAGGSGYSAFSTGDGGTVATPTTGLTSSISGTATVYAPAGDNTKKGGGGTQSPSALPAAGIVIVAVQTSPPTASGVVASGGTETTFTGDGTNGVSGQGYKVHTFTASGSLVVSAAPAGSVVECLVVGGGGAGGNSGGGGGGAGGMLEVFDGVLPVGTVPVVVGAGGVGFASPGGNFGLRGSNGGASMVGPYVAPGGGGGGGESFQLSAGGRVPLDGTPGGSGGGGAAVSGGKAGGVGLAGLGFAGGVSNVNGGGGGGGAGAVGVAAGGGGAAGGAGRSSSINGTATLYGGGGGAMGGAGGAGGSGGGGAGADTGSNGTANRGGGGGGCAAGSSAGSGGSGVVIVRYKV